MPPAAGKHEAKYGYNQPAGDEQSGPYHSWPVAVRRVGLPCLNVPSYCRHGSQLTCELCLARHAPLLITHAWSAAPARRSLSWTSIAVDARRSSALGPLQGVGDPVDDVRSAASSPAGAPRGRSCISAGRITWPPSGLERADRTVGRAVEHAEQFPHRGGRAGAEVDGGCGPRQAIEPSQRGDVRRGQIPDMDVVSHARSVPGRPVGSGDQERHANGLTMASDSQVGITWASA